MRAAKLTAILLLILVLAAGARASGPFGPLPGPPPGPPMPITNGNGGGSGGGGGNSNSGIGGTKMSVPGTDNVYNVQNYGATGNGSTDDTTAIQTAYNTACNAAGNDHNAPSVYLPMPTTCYKITRPIVEMCYRAQPRLWGASEGLSTVATAICPNFNGPAIVTRNQSEVQAGTLASALMSMTSSLVTGSGNSLTWATNASGFLDFYDVVGVQSTSPPVGPMNGLSQITIRGFFKWGGNLNTNAFYPIWASDGAFDDHVQGCQAGFIGLGNCTISMGYMGIKGADSKLYAALRIGSTTYSVNSGATTVTAGTIYEFELNFDGSNVNEYLGPVGGTVSRVAQHTSVSGTVSQRVDENFYLGADAPYWPYYQNIVYWNGALDSIEIANTARHTGSSFSADSSKFVADSHTLFLDNFDLNQFPSVTLNGFTTQYPYAQVDNASVPNGATGSTAWLVIRNPGWGCCGGLYEISNLSISGNETTGILDDAAAVDVRNITGTGEVVGIRLGPNATFGSRLDEIYLHGNMSSVIALGGISRLTRLDLGSPAYGLVTAANNVEDVYILPNANTTCGIVTVEAGSFPQNGFRALNFDSENGGTFNALCLKNSRASTTLIDSSSIAASGAATIKLVASTAGNITLTNNEIFTASSMPIVDDSEVGGPGGNLGVLRLQGNNYVLSNASSSVLPSGITATNGGGLAFDIAPTPQAVTGTSAGSFIWSEPTNTTNKKVVDVNLLAYENTTGTAQTVTLPNGGLSVVSSVTALTGTCTNVTISTTTITLPSSMGSTQTGLCEAVGY